MDRVGHPRDVVGGPTVLDRAGTSGFALTRGELALIAENVRDAVLALEVCYACERVSDTCRVVGQRACAGYSASLEYEPIYWCGDCLSRAKR